jgi:hypothetical protein
VKNCSFSLKLNANCMEHTRPSLAIGMESIKNFFIDAKSRGVKLRYLTEITDANISYCRELMSIVDEVRHLDGLLVLGDHNYTVHIIRHAFDDMKGYESENVIKRAIYDRGN